MSSQLKPNTTVPQFYLPASTGEEVTLSHYRGRHNLILVFLGGGDCPACLELLSGLATEREQLRWQKAQVLAFLAGSVAEASAFRERHSLLFPLLADAEGETHRAFAASQKGVPAPAVFVTDRFTTLYASYYPAPGMPLPTVPEVLEWLEFINLQCPE